MFKAFISHLFLSSKMREWFLLLSNTPFAMFSEKKVPIKYLSAKLIVLQIPPPSLSWPWCLENTWQFLLLCWLMQLHRFFTLHISLLFFDPHLEWKDICPCTYSSELNCSQATIEQWVNNNNQVNKFVIFTKKKKNPPKKPLLRRFPPSFFININTVLLLLHILHSSGFDSSMRQVEKLQLNPEAKRLLQTCVLLCKILSFCLRQWVVTF